MIVDMPDTVSIIDLLQFAHSQGLELRHDNEHKKTLVEPGNVRKCRRELINLVGNHPNIKE